MTESPNSPFPIDYASPRTDVFPPIRGRAKAAIYSLVALLIIDALLTGVMFMAGPLQEAVKRHDPKDAAMLVAGGLTMMFAGCSQVIVFILAVVLFCMWIHRASRAAHYFTPNMEYSPGWSVGWFFIPIMNWFKPYQAVSELCRVSAHDASGAAEYRQGPSPGLVLTWWLCYIFGGIVSYIASQLIGHTDLAMIGALLNIVGTAMTLLSGIIIIRIIHFITGSLESRYYGAAPAVPSAPQ